MATNPYGGASALPLTLLAQAIPMLSRHDLECVAERLIDRLDLIKPDPDIENEDPLEDDDMDCCEARDDGLPRSPLRRSNSSERC